jgi:hypothetical protein
MEEDAYKSVRKAWDEFTEAATKCIIANEE